VSCFLCHCGNISTAMKADHRFVYSCTGMVYKYDVHIFPVYGGGLHVMLPSKVARAAGTGFKSLPAYWMMFFAIFLSPHSAFSSMGTVRSFPVVNRVKREVDHSPLSSAEVKNEWSLTSSPSVRLYIVYRYTDWGKYLVVSILVYFYHFVIRDLKF
jgi:hypothetical protein